MQGIIALRRNEEIRMEICTFGVGGRQRACEAELSATVEGRYARLVLLPIPTTKDGEHVSATDTPLEEILTLVGRGVLVAGYNIPDALCERIFSLGGEIYDAALDEDFLLENAEITAEGALGKILCHFKKAPRELYVGIVGYGRIGKALTRLLLFLGARVKVYTRKEATRLYLAECGVDSSHGESADDFFGLDLIVNTAPAPFLCAEAVERLSGNTAFIDLASGKNFEDTAPVIKLSSVPDAMYPDTAGKIYARYISRHLL